MPPKSRPDKPVRFQTWLLKSMLLVLLVALFLGGIIVAGRWGMAHLRLSDRYHVAFTKIECNPPPGMDKQRFLEEVLYYASPHLPERLNVLDDDLADLLRAGFAMHPWVEEVNHVEIKPTKQIHVTLTHRTPVLAVKIGAKVRAVDGTGMLLPEGAPTVGLRIYEGEAKTPQGTGLRWGDPNVEAAARKLKK